MTISLQDQYALKSICFGCGPANAQGLQIKSFVKGDVVVATFTAQPFMQAFPGVLNGGIIGTLLDCHANWTAAWAIMNKLGLNQTPCTVTAEYSVKLKRPTPIDKPIELIARAIDVKDDRATIEAELIVDGKVCDTCTGLFVAVKEGHPAFYRW